MSQTWVKTYIRIQAIIGVAILPILAIAGVVWAAVRAATKDTSPGPSLGAAIIFAIIFLILAALSARRLQTLKNE